MKDKTIGLIVIGSWIGVIEVVALFKDVNGQLLITAIGALVGIFGYFMGRREQVDEKTPKNVV